MAKLPRPEDMLSRLTAAYITDSRNNQVNFYTTWKDEIQNTRRILRGDWKYKGPDGKEKTVRPIIQNTMEKAVRDISRIANESQPSVTSPAKTDKDSSENKAITRGTIADTYWEENEGNLIVPNSVIDLLSTGAAFWTAWANPDSSDYPQFTRIDPLVCYPTVENGRLIDLLVVRTMKKRIAAGRWPELGITSDPGDSDDVELAEYYSHDECAKAVLTLDGHRATGTVHWLSAWRPELQGERPPVAFRMLPSHDGAFHGMYDQMGTSLEVKNRLAQMVADYGDQGVYAPFKAKGVINVTDKPGPKTIYQLDPLVEGADMARVEPAGNSPSTLALLQFLDGEHRGAASYPESRQGTVHQSIASASFVQSTQGEETSVVKETQDLIASMRRQITEIAMQLDCKFLNFSKPLTNVIDGRKTYVPEDAIEGVYRVRVTYGAAAGLDRLNADNRLLSHQTSGWISKREARSQLDYIDDPDEMEREIEAEMGEEAVKQRFFADPNTPLPAVAQVWIEMRKNGLTLVEALEKTMPMLVEMQKQPAQQGAAPEPPAPGEEAPGGEGTPLQNGIPGAATGSPGEQPGVEPDFAAPPISQVINRL